MGNLIYNKESIQKQLGNLSNDAQLCFGILCCERLLPNYLAFMHETGWGDIAILRRTLDELWNHLINEDMSNLEVKALIQECERNAPDSDNFDSLLTAAAQDAVFATCSLLDYILTGDTERVAQASSYSIDSIDLYVQEIESIPANSSDIEDLIRGHVLMQEEIHRQQDDLRFIENNWEPSVLQKERSNLNVGNLKLR